MTRSMLFKIISAAAVLAVVAAIVISRNHSAAGTSPQAPTRMQQVSNAVREVESRVRGGIGIGVQLDPVSKCPQVSSVAPRSPAAYAGLAPGDVILRADGQSLAGMPFTNVMGILRGFAGLSTHLTIQRLGTVTTTNIVVRRASVKDLQNL